MENSASKSEKIKQNDTILNNEHKKDIGNQTNFCTSFPNSFQIELAKRNGQLRSIVSELEYHCEVYKLGLRSIRKILKYYFGQNVLLLPESKSQFQRDNSANYPPPLKYSGRVSYRSAAELVQQRRALEKINGVIRKTKTFINGYSLLEKTNLSCPNKATTDEETVTKNTSVQSLATYPTFSTAATGQIKSYSGITSVENPAGEKSQVSQVSKAGGETIKKGNGSTSQKRGCNKMSRFTDAALKEQNENSSNTANAPAELSQVDSKSNKPRRTTTVFQRNKIEKREIAKYSRNFKDLKRNRFSEKGSEKYSQRSNSRNERDFGSKSKFDNSLRAYSKRPVKSFHSSESRNNYRTKIISKYQNMTRNNRKDEDGNDKPFNKNHSTITRIISERKENPNPLIRHSTKMQYRNRLKETQKYNRFAENSDKERNNRQRDSQGSHPNCIRSIGNRDGKNRIPTITSRTSFPTRTRNWDQNNDNKSNYFRTQEKRGPREYVNRKYENNNNFGKLALSTKAKQDGLDEWKSIGLERDAQFNKDKLKEKKYQTSNSSSCGVNSSRNWKSERYQKRKSSWNYDDENDNDRINGIEYEGKVRRVNLYPETNYNQQNYYEASIYSERKSTAPLNDNQNQEQIGEFDVTTGNPGSIKNTRAGGSNCSYTSGGGLLSSTSSFDSQFSQQNEQRRRELTSVVVENPLNTAVNMIGRNSENQLRISPSSITPLISNSVTQTFLQDPRLVRRKLQPQK